MAISHVSSELLLTPEQCAAVIEWAGPHVRPRAGKPGVSKAIQAVDAVCLDDGELRRTRRPEVKLFQDWLTKLCADRDFDLYDMLVSFSVIRYQVGSFMAQHRDDFQESPNVVWGWGATIQLSPPEDYEGGDLVIDGAPQASREQGMATATEFGTLHHVTTVTRGERWILGGWAFENRLMHKSSPRVLARSDPGYAAQSA